MQSSENDHGTFDAEPPHVSLEQLRSELGVSHRRSERWESRTADLTAFLGVDPADDVVLKVHFDGASEEPRSRVALTARCAAHARLSGEQAFSPEILAWGLDPAFLLMRRIPGDDLHDLLADAGPAARDRVLAWLEQAGEVLARFHLAMDHDPPTTGRPAYASRWIRLAERLGGDGWSGVEVWSVIDPAVQNFRIDRHGAMWLIDLPERAVVVPVEFDLARLAFRLAYAMDDGSGRALERRTIHTVVATAVFDGYARRRPEFAVEWGVLYALVLIEILHRAALRFRPHPAAMARLGRELWHAGRILLLLRRSKRRDTLQR